jgi:hypothetical protein
VDTHKGQRISATHIELFKSIVSMCTCPGRQAEAETRGDWLRHEDFSPTRKVRDAAKSSSPSFDAPPSFSCHQSHRFAFVRLTMFSRTIPRAAPRISALSRCQAQSLLHRTTKLPVKQCSPLQQQLGRRCKSSSIGGQFKAQYKRSPVLFPFAVVM